MAQQKVKFMALKYLALITSVFLHCVAGGQTYESQRMENSSVKESNIHYVKLTNGFKVWTKRVGEGPITILLLHGGPGYTHECLECFENFFPKDSFQIIYYDQLGSYYSDQPNDPTLWNITRFTEEVEEVRQALKLENFYLYGFSWGSMLAIEYALKHQNHLKGLILSNMTASLHSYELYLNQLKNQLPSHILAQLEAYEKNGDMLNPEYEKLLFEHFYKCYLCKLDPWPEALLRCGHHFNRSVCDAIFGPNEFAVTGNCKEWNRWKELAQIQVPTLVIGARYDTMNPKDIEKMGELLPNSTVKICENGSHLCMHDDQEDYFKALKLFIKNTDKEKK